MNTQELIWKPIKNYSEYYEISTDGRVRSFDRIIYDKNGIRLRLNKSKEISSRNGLYKMVGLNKNRIQTQISIHRLVALAFLPNPENKPQVNHIDGDKLNNNMYNLEWVTAKENVQHAFDKGLKKPTWLNKKLSKETKLKMSISKKGKVAHNKGKRQKEQIHGTLYSYNNYKCKCELCKKANTDYCRNKTLTPTAIKQIGL